MSETARIREAMRALHNLRPDDPRTEGHYAASKLSAHDVALRYGEIVTRARQDVFRRLRGLEGLFGEDVARPLAEAVEELTEAHAAALDMHELARYVNGQSFERRTRELLGELHQLRSIVSRALQDLDARQKRMPAGRRREPEWAAEARTIEELPF